MEHTLSKTVPAVLKEIKIPEKIKTLEPYLPFAAVDRVLLIQCFKQLHIPSFAEMTGFIRLRLETYANNFHLLEAAGVPKNLILTPGKEVTKEVCSAFVSAVNEIASANIFRIDLQFDFDEDALISYDFGDGDRAACDCNNLSDSEEVSKRVLSYLGGYEELCKIKTWDEGIEAINTILQAFAV